MTTLDHLAAENRALAEEVRTIRAQLLRHEHAACQDWSWESFGCKHDAPRHRTLCGKCRTCWPCDVIQALDLVAPAEAQP